MSRVLAFASDSGSPVRFVFGPDGFSAVRNLSGVWSSPSPARKMGDFAEGFEMLVPSAAEDLSKEARESLSLLPDLWAPATSPVMAFAADGDSQVRFVFGPGRFSAVRDLAGAWRSPAPDCKVGDFAEGFEMLVPSAAEALSKEACGALLGTGSI